MVNLWRDNDEHSKSAEEQVIGSNRKDAEETHVGEEEDREDVIPNSEICDDNCDDDGLDNNYEYGNEI